MYNSKTGIFFTKNIPSKAIDKSSQIFIVHFTQVCVQFSWQVREAFDFFDQSNCLFENNTNTKGISESCEEKLLERRNIMEDQKLPIDNQQEYFLEGFGQTPLVVSSRDSCFPSVKNKKKHFEDMPDEVILNMLNFLELPDLIRFGLVSKRLRSVSFIESLWQKIDISKSGHSRKIVPTDLVKKIINRSCKSLCLRECKIIGNLKHSDFSLDLNYWFNQEEKTKFIDQIRTEKKLRIEDSSDSSDSDSDSDSDCDFMCRKRIFSIKRIKTETKMGTSQLISLDLTNCKVKHCVMNVLLTACHSLKNLSLRKAVLTPFMFEIICYQNGQTLQTLDLTLTNGTNDYSQNFLPSDMLLIVNNCVILKEVDFSGCRLSENCVEILVNNISQNVEKLGLGGPGIHAEDEHIVALVSRCNKISSLNLSFGRELTDISLTSIILNLKFTLEELDIGYCQLITHAKLFEMKEMPKLKALNYGTGMSRNIFHELKKTLPQLTRNKNWRQKWEDLLIP